MHRVREVLSVACLCHRRSYIVVLSTSWPLNTITLRANTCHSIDCCVCTRNWLLARTAVVNPVSVLLWIVLYWRRGVHAHYVAEVWHVGRAGVGICLSLGAGDHWIIRVIRIWHTLVWARSVTWVVGMAWRDHIVILLRHVLRVV